MSVTSRLFATKLAISRITERAALFCSSIPVEGVERCLIYTYLKYSSEIAIHYCTKLSLFSASAVTQGLTDLGEIQEIPETQGCPSIPGLPKLIVRLAKVPFDCTYSYTIRAIYKSVNFNVCL